jgi:hypothetical protein
MEARPELAAADLATVALIDLRASAQWARIAGLLFGAAAETAEREIAKGEIKRSGAERTARFDESEPCG